MSSQCDSSTGRDGLESVVVPNVPVPSTDACLRSLSPLGVRTVVVSEDPRASSFRSVHCDEAVLVPDPTADLDGYAEALLALARREDVRAIIPVREEDAFVLSKHRARFAKYVSTPWPTLETLERVHDRVRLAEAAESAGVPAPKTVPLEAAEGWTSRSIVKSRYNLVVGEYVDTVPPGAVRGSKAIEHVTPGERPDVEALREEFGHDPIVQAFVPIEEEYMFGALCDHGEPVATVQHKQKRGASYVGGGGVYRESTDVPELEDVATALLRELDWHGLACIEYMRHPETGAFYLTEINPRMWTSLAANVRMGADFPRSYWQLATDSADEIESGYDLDVGCHYLKGELMYVLNLFRDESTLVNRPPIARTLAEIIDSCYRQPNFDVLAADDVWPFLQDGLAEFDAVSPLPFELAELGRRVGPSVTPVHWREAAHTPSGDTPRRASRSFGQIRQ
jgi:predicted ATP-grasp superfamily ATP-dependent carboligase